VLFTWATVEHVGYFPEHHHARVSVSSVCLLECCWSASVLFHVVHARRTRGLLLSTWATFLLDLIRVHVSVSACLLECFGVPVYWSCRVSSLLIHPLVRRATYLLVPDSSWIGGLSIFYFYMAVSSSLLQPYMLSVLDSWTAFARVLGTHQLAYLAPGFPRFGLGFFMSSLFIFLKGFRIVWATSSSDWTFCCLCRGCCSSAR
jgi:hypothetical protein